MLILLNLLQPTDLNPRRIFNERALCESLITSGLNVPLQVHKNAKGSKFEILRGGRRYKALMLIAKEFPTKFQEKFGKGIPCEVHENLSEIQKIDIVNDHGSLLPLSNQFEIYLTCKGYFRMQYSENKTLQNIQTMLDSVLPLTGKTAIEVNELRKELDRSNVQTREIRAEAFLKRLFSARRGIMQRYKHIYDNPLIIEACMEYKWLGSIPTGYNQDDLAILTDTDLTALSKCYVNEVVEVGDDDKGRPLVNKTKPGTKFLKAFDVIKHRKKKDTTVKVDKVLTKQKILQPSDSGEIASGAMSRVLKYHAGSKTFDVTSVLQADMLLEVVELLMEHDETLWIQCCNKAKEIKAKLIAELASK